MKIYIVALLLCSFLNANSQDFVKSDNAALLGRWQVTSFSINSTTFYDVAKDSFSYTIKREVPDIPGAHEQDDSVSAMFKKDIISEFVKDNKPLNMEFLKTGKLLSGFGNDRDGSCEYNFDESKRVIIMKNFLSKDFEPLPMGEMQVGISLSTNMLSLEYHQNSERVVVSFKKV